MRELTCYENGIIAGGVRMSDYQASIKQICNTNGFPNGAIVTLPMGVSTNTSVTASGIVIGGTTGVEAAAPTVSMSCGEARIDFSDVIGTVSSTEQMR